MIEIELYEKIRYLYAVEGKSQRAIARELNISRNTVRRYCKGENVPWERKARKYKAPITGSVKNIVEKWLKEDEQAPKKQRHTAERVYQRLVEEHGFTGSASAIRKLVKELKNSGDKAYVPLAFDPGEAAQGDWGEATFYLGGEKTTCQLFCYRLCYSGAPYVTAFPRQRQEAFLAGHVMSFGFFNGVPRKIFYDNLKTAVKEGWGRYVTKEQTPFKALKSHYAFTSVFCNPGAGNEKGLVENLVGYIRRNVFVPLPRVNSYEELQDELKRRCLQYIERHKIQYRPNTVKEALEQEQQKLISLPVKEFEYALTETPVVQRDGLVKFDANRYSVPISLAGRRVTAKGYPLKVEFYYRSQLVAVHRRSYLKGQTFMEFEHYLPLLAAKPRSLYNAAPLRQGALPPALESIKDKLLSRGNDREMAGIIRLLISHGVEAVEEAAALALKNGQLSSQALRYYLTQEAPAEVILTTPGPTVRPVDLKSYDRLIGGVAN